MWFNLGADLCEINELFFSCLGPEMSVFHGLGIIHYVILARGKASDGKGSRSSLGEISSSSP